MLPLLLLGLLAHAVLADLGKPVLYPDGLKAPTDAANITLLQPKVYIDVVPPQMCLDKAQAEKCDTSKVEARKITYGDCDAPWTLCRCGDAPMR